MLHGVQEKKDSNVIGHFVRHNRLLGKLNSSSSFDGHGPGGLRGYNNSNIDSRSGSGGGGSGIGGGNVSVVHDEILYAMLGR